MSSEILIRVEHLSKRYHVYEEPVHRLLQMFSGQRKAVATPGKISATGQLPVGRKSQ